MKKLVFAMSIAFVVLMAVACKQSGNKTSGNADSTASTPHPAIPANGITLNGILFPDADKMVTAFTNDNNNTDPKINIWLSRDWVEAVYDLVKNKEGGDGVRFYFAKRADGKNTLIIVSTKYDSTNPGAPSRGNHNDYFDHNSTFLSSANALNLEDYVGDPAMAKLYSNFTCPAETCNITAINYISCADALAAVTKFGAGQITSSSEWFSIDLIGQLRDELTAAQAKIPADGIRIYFAKNKLGTPTLVIVTTKKVEAAHQDYFECYGNALNFNAPAKRPTAKGDTSISDNGEQCPNNCNGTTWPKP